MFVFRAFSPKKPALGLVHSQFEWYHLCQNPSCPFLPSIPGIRSPGICISPTSDVSLTDCFRKLSDVLGRRLCLPSDLRGCILEERVFLTSSPFSELGVLRSTCEGAGCTVRFASTSLELPYSGEPAAVFHLAYRIWVVANSSISLHAQHFPVTQRQHILLSFAAYRLLSACPVSFHMLPLLESIKFQIHLIT